MDSLCLHRPRLPPHHKAKYSVRHVPCCQDRHAAPAGGTGCTPSSCGCVCGCQPPQPRLATGRLMASGEAQRALTSSLGSYAPAQWSRVQTLRKGARMPASTKRLRTSIPEESVATTRCQRIGWSELALLSLPLPLRLLPSPSLLLYPTPSSRVPCVWSQSGRRRSGTLALDDIHDEMRYVLHASRMTTLTIQLQPKGR